MWNAKRANWRLQLHWPICKFLIANVLRKERNKKEWSVKSRMHVLQNLTLKCHSSRTFEERKVNKNDFNWQSISHQLSSGKIQDLICVERNKFSISAENKRLKMKPPERAIIHLIKFLLQELFVVTHFELISKLDRVLLVVHKTRFGIIWRL